MKHETLAYKILFPSFVYCVNLSKSTGRNENVLLMQQLLKKKKK